MLLGAAIVRDWSPSMQSQPVSWRMTILPWRWPRWTARRVARPPASSTVSLGTPHWRSSGRESCPKSTMAPGNRVRAQSCYLIIYSKEAGGPEEIVIIFRVKIIDNIIIKLVIWWLFGLNRDFYQKLSHSSITFCSRVFVLPLFNKLLYLYFIISLNCLSSEDFKIRNCFHGNMNATSSICCYQGGSMARCRTG